jgi:hypothetical protein
LRPYWWNWRRHPTVRRFPSIEPRANAVRHGAAGRVEHERDCIITCLGATPDSGNFAASPRLNPKFFPNQLGVDAQPI